MSLRSCVFVAAQEKCLLPVELPCQLLELLRVLVGVFPEPCRRGGLRPIAEAVAVALAADLEPEARRVLPPLELILEREPGVIFLRVPGQKAALRRGKSSRYEDSGAVADTFPSASRKARLKAPSSGS